MAQLCLWLAHVPRTGGTGLSHCCKQHFHKLAFHANGHYGYTQELHAELLRQHDEVRLLTVLRDPVEHTRSWYAYTRDDPDHSLYEFSKARTFSEWLRDYTEDYGSYFTWFFDRKERKKKTWLEGRMVQHGMLFRYAHTPSLGAAVETIKKFDYVFDTATLTDQFNALLAELGEPAKLEPLSKAHSHEKGALTEEDVAVVKQLRADDYALLEQLSALSIANIKLLH